MTKFTKFYDQFFLFSQSIEYIYKIINRNYHIAYDLKGILVSRVSH